MISMNEFNPFLISPEVKEIYFMVKNIKEISEKHVVTNKMPKLGNKLSEIAKNIQQAKPSDLTFKMLLEGKLQTQWFRDARTQALEDYKNSKFG